MFRHGLFSEKLSPCARATAIHDREGVVGAA